MQHVNLLRADDVYFRVRITAPDALAQTDFSGAEISQQKIDRADSGRNSHLKHHEGELQRSPQPT